MMTNTWSSLGIVDCADAEGMTAMTPPAARQVANSAMAGMRRRRPALSLKSLAGNGIVPPCDRCRSARWRQAQMPDEPVGVNQAGLNYPLRDCDIRALLGPRGAERSRGRGHAAAGGPACQRAARGTRALVTGR